MSDTRNRLIGIVGTANVTESPDFSSSAVWVRSGTEDLAPDFLVKPKNSDEVQEIVKLANELKLPLIPVSSSGSHTSGGVHPEAPGAVVVDLSGMNKILKINRHHCLALIEPGVTWEKLTAELAERGLRITQPLLPKKGKSVIASLVDREPLLSPRFQYNMTEPLRSMEIVFGTGDRVFSGLGVHLGNSDEKWEGGEVPITNAGPHQFDFIKMVSASQGTMGIVTTASIKVEPAAKEEKALFVHGKSFEQLTDFLYKTLKFRFGDEVCIFNKKALSSILAEDAADMAASEAQISQWTALVNLKWGGLRPKEKIAVWEADIADIAQENGLVPSLSVAGVPAAKVTDRVLALDENDWKNKTTGASKEIFYLSTLDKISGQLKKAAEVCDSYGFSFADCPVYLQPLHQGTAVHCSIVLPVSPDQPESENLKNMYQDLSRELVVEGAFFSRPYGIWADIMYDGNTPHANLTMKMKDIFDPEHIMNPGKLCF